MKLKRYSVVPLTCLLGVLGGLIFVASCGGGSSSPPPPSNPVPSITSLSPSSASAGAAAQTLTITGTNFLSSSTVTYNAAAHTATYVSSTQLTIALSTSDLATAGTYPVVVTNPSPGGGASNTVNFSVTVVKNVLSLNVNLGPTDDYVNGLFASVEVCEPGSTSNCTTVPDVLVDTGSVGLRLLSGALGSLSLPAVTDSSGNEIQECIQFISLAYIWGPVEQADIHLAGETASNAAVQIISESPSPATPPQSCLTVGVSGATDYDSVSALGANGILGVANYTQDCSGCTLASNDIPQYFVCPSGNCTIANVPSDGIVSNPVSLFSTDNNGVLVSLPTIPSGGAATASGSLIFGIGTESNNALGSAKIYATNDQEYFTTTYSGTAYGDSFIDSGSNALYFLDSATLGNIDCAAPNSGWYCPSSTLSFTVTNTGANGTSGSVIFSIENAETLFNTGYAAFNDLGGDSGTSPSTDYFDFGVPFFYGRNVFVGIAGQTVTGVTDVPYGFWAY